MKEIDINIEGYNVNGICVGCLNYNRRMFKHNDVKECFRLLANIDVPDGLEIQVCWECFAYIRKAIKFKEQILVSYEFLIQYSQEHTFLDSPNDFEPYSSTSIVRSDVTTVDWTPKIEEDDVFVEKEDIKNETEESFDFELPVKEETEETTFEEITPLNEKIIFDNLSDVRDYTSDEDVLLSKLKVKDDLQKPKRRRKKVDRSKEKQEESETLDDKTEEKSKSRKLKNLPEDLVELYTMSKEEMMTVRNEDLNSKEFQKLKYRCDDCIIGFNTEKLMNDHLNGKHQKKAESCHQCTICRAYFLTKDNVWCHRSLHLSAYRCVQCGFVTSLKRRMIEHVREHDVVDKAHVCASCGNEFSTKSKLNYHRGVCLQERPQCDCCGKVFANKMTLKYHLKIPQSSKEHKPKEKLYIPCKGCDKVFHSKKSYRAHVVIHDGLTYPCPICGKLFQWKRNLARHTRNHREREAGALHECRQCGKSFASRDCYNNHMRLSKKHVAEDTYQHECSYCSKKFPTKWCLTDHIDWEHLKVVKYQCNVCFKPFKTAKIMVAHVNNIHKGKKKEDEGEHLCEICGKSYKTVKRLKGHVWAMHTKRSSGKNYKCKLCPATFTWQTSIYKHMKTMHDNTKKNKVTRTAPLVKKEDAYPGIELANRMQYFQQNLANNFNIVHIQPLGMTQNIV